jgi:hypothetical protein
LTKVEQDRLRKKQEAEMKNMSKNMSLDHMRNTRQRDIEAIQEKLRKDDERTNTIKQQR